MCLITIPVTRPYIARGIEAIVDSEIPSDLFVRGPPMDCVAVNSRNVDHESAKSACIYTIQAK